MEQLTLIQFLVAICMSLAGVCFFIWGTLSGLFRDIESVKYDMLRRELGAGEGGDHEHE